MLKSVMDDRGGCLLISGLLGFGLATMFRRACVGGKCYIIKGPAREVVGKHVWRVDGRCYHYRPVATSCAAKK